jgi:hypothetical protein
VTEDPRPRGWGHHLVGVLLTVAVFVALGPIVGGVLFLTMNSVWYTAYTGAPVMEAVAGLFAFLVYLPFSVPLSYLKGWQAAAATGLVAAVSSAWVASARALYAVTTIAGGMLSALFLWIGDRAVVNDAAGVVTVGIDAAVVALVFLTGCAAAAICTRIARQFRLTARLRAKPHASGTVP